MDDSKDKSKKKERPSKGKVLFVVLAVTSLVVLVIAVVRWLPVTNRYYTDADTIREPLHDARTRDILWQPPRPLSEIINTTADDYEPRLSSDGLTLYFVRGKAGGHADIFISQKIPKGWTAPTSLREVNSEFDDLGPEPSADGQSLYFYSDRVGGVGGFDLWVAHRSISGEWLSPINLGPNVNSAYNDYGPALTPDGGMLYFSSNRPRLDDARQLDPNAWPATIREESFHRDYDLYAATITDAGVSGAKALTLLNTPHNEGAPAVSSFGDFLYFASDRPGGMGGFDLYRCWRIQGVLREPVNLGSSLNTTANEMDPGLGLGGYALYFSSDRAVATSTIVDEAKSGMGPALDQPDVAGSLEAGPKLREYNLYHTTSREVFSDAERIERAAVNWAAVWSAVWPHLLWALLALLFLLGLWWLLRDARGRRLSLLAKCLLASLMAHLLLLLFFNVWEVTASLAREFHRRGRIQIALASPSSGVELARQIHGPLTEIETPRAVETPVQRQQMTVTQELSTTRVVLDVERAAIDTGTTRLMEVSARDVQVVQETETPAPMPPAPEETIVDLNEALLPSESVRMATAEPQEAVEAEMPRLSTERPDMRPDTPLVKDSLARLAPTVIERDASSGLSSSLATSPDAPEAQTTSREAVEPNPTRTVVDVHTPGAISLPDAPVDRPSETPEPTMHVAGEIIDAKLRELPQSTGAGHDENVMTLVNPAAVRLPISDQTLVTAAPEPVRDVEWNDESPTPPMSATTQMAWHESISDLPLSVPEVATAEDGPEADSGQVEPRVSPVRAEMQGDTAHLETVQALVSVDSVTLADRAEVLSFVTVPADRIQEVPPLGGSTPPPVARTTIPEKSEFVDDLDVGVPQEDSSSALVSVEPQSAAVAAQVSALRAEIVDEQGASPSDIAAVRIEPESIPRMIHASMAEPARTVAEATPMNGDAVPSAATSVPSSLPEMIEVNVQLPTASEAVAFEDAAIVNVAAKNVESPRPALTVTEIPDSKAAPRFDVIVLRTAAADENEESSNGIVVAIAENTPTGHDIVPELNTPSVIDFSPSDLSVFDLSLPKDQQWPENPYAQRKVPDRLEIVQRMGGSEATEQAVANALKWLAAHQSEDGRWDGDAFDARCEECGGQTDILVDHALTGLALLCFYGAGHTHATDGPYRDAVRQGLTWLLSQQAADGDLRGEETMYSHGIATIAMSEAYGMTRDAALPRAVSRAVHFIDRARNRDEGGWRYDPGQAGDTSVLGWQVMALKSAAMNGVTVPTGAFRAAREWMERVSQPSRPGLYSYQPGQPATPSMTAEGMFVQQLLGIPHDDPRMNASAEYIVQHLPEWDSNPNTYYWYYATLALFHHQGSHWKTWNAALTKELTTHQRTDGKAAGSWDPVGEWGHLGGRVYQTALCTLMLEVYYRYLPLYANDAPIDPIGAIRGYVTDAATGDALSGAMVRLDLPDREPVSVSTAADGSFLLLSPEVPDHFALSASRGGYVPSTVDVSSAKVKGTTLALDFTLSPEGAATVAIEAVPEVHHLGDNEFEGRINSQFQKRSEGSEYATAFRLTATQVAPHITEAEVRLLAKGVQRRHTLRINGTALKEKLDNAPGDGSFGEFVTSFDPELLQEGENRFELIAQPSDVDIDDFEFVNVRIMVR